MNKISQEESWVSIIQKCVEQCPEKIGFEQLDEDGCLVQSLSYRMLYERISAVVEAIRAVTQPGDRVLMLYPTDLEFVVAVLACLISGVVAVPVYPPLLNTRQLNFSLLRLQHVLHDAKPSAVLTSSQLIAAVKGHGEAMAAAFSPLFQLPVIASDVLISPKKLVSLHEASANEAAVLQYTSGSTADPKAVVLTHQNLLNNVGNMVRLRVNGHGVETFVSWLPLYHDMGLMGSIFVPLYMGVKSVLMPTMGFLKNPATWLEVISRYPGVMSGGPNFAYELCLQRIAELSTLNFKLDSWKAAYLGAETTQPETLRRFTEFFSQIGFDPHVFVSGYGLAECTLFVTGGELSKGAMIRYFDREQLHLGRVQEVQPSDAQAMPIVSVGTSFSDHDVVIVDPETRQVLSSNQVGEIWVKGPSVAQGYWNKRELTQETFHGITNEQQGPFLRTGDFGFICGKELFHYSRLKDVIIVRGRTVAPQDIEWAVEKSDMRVQSSGVAAFSVKSDLNEAVVVVVELKKEEDVSSLKELTQIIRAVIVMNFGIKPKEIRFVPSGWIPKTISGKVQRSASRNKLYSVE